MAGAPLYDRLGVAPDADLATLRAAYRGLARRLHPDLVAAGAEPAANLAMALVNEAWGSSPTPPAEAATTRPSARRPRPQAWPMQGRRRAAPVVVRPPRAPPPRAPPPAPAPPAARPVHGAPHRGPPA